MSTALYRRYRPETFADVIGQEHVTEPLMAALAADRVTHAYLFSGPRGCGKTTSARILARCLNCAQGPTATPCGQCESCVDLARGGPGSLDVVEIDAASHNGVDDARELRERAAFAPARDRYKIFILDEAHMVTTQGFNALLKLVEEPPPHIKFVFATTEPDKVIGTIRSRTHHYPFRLVAPEKLTAYLQSLAEAEGIEVDGGVLPLVVRAGGGSVRDSLSVLDQLIAGTTDNHLTYSRAVALLGFTHATLLDDAVDALAARDGLSLFRVVDRVIESGHAPRRFVEDLLERLRDLIVVRAAGDQAASVLRTVPADQLERMHIQAQHMGAGALSRAADLVNEGLTEMTGATSPRLHLELLCARLLLPAADDGVDGFAARLDRLEAQIGGAAPPVPAAVPGQGRSGQQRPHTDDGEAHPGSAGRPAQHAPQAEPPGGARHPAAAEPQPDPRPAAPTREAAPRRDPAAPGAPVTAPPEPVEPAPAPAARTERPAPEGHAAVHAEAAAPAQPGTAQGGRPPAREPEGSGALTTDQVRRRWPEVLETLAQLKRTTWALVSQDAQVVELTESTLSLGFSTEGLATAFRTGPHASFLSQALRETLGVEVQIQPVLGSGPGGGAPSGPPAPAPDPAALRPEASGSGRRPDAGGPAGDQFRGSDRPGAGPGGSGAAGAGAADGPARARQADLPGGHPPGGAPGTAHATAAGATGSPPAGAGAPGDGWADIPVRRPPQDPPAPRATADDVTGNPGTGGAGTRGAAPQGAAPPGAAPHGGAPGPAGPPWDEPVPAGATTPAGRMAGHAGGGPATVATSGPATSTSPGPATTSPPAPGSSTAPAPDEPPASALLAAPPRDPHAPPPVTRLGDEMDDSSPEDPDLEHTEVVGAPLVARLLGGVVIDEEIDDGEEPR